MAQLSLYLPESTMVRLRTDAEKARTSVSRYVATLINREDASAGWPEGYWESVYGALTDPTFVVPPELDPSLDDPVPSFAVSED